MSIEKGISDYMYNHLEWKLEHVHNRTGSTVTMESETGTHIHLTSSDVIGAKGIHIEGNSVTLDGKNNITRERYEHEASSSGLSISLGGSVANAATTAVNYLQQANHRSDKRLAALETLEAGKSLKEGLNAVNAFSHFSVSDVQNAYDTAAASAARDAELARATKQPRDVIAAKELQADELHRIAKDPKAVQDRYNQEKAAKRDSLVNIHVGIGSSHSKSVTEVNETTYAGGSVQSADGTVRIIARGDGDTTSHTKGDITAIGQTIQGKVVDVEAKGDVNLLAGTNTTHVTEDSKSSGWSVGASIGTTGFLGGDIGINKAKSEGLTDRTTHTGTTVVGSHAVTITSGQNTNVVGSTVSGDKVVAKVGNDLTITSVQDTDNYKANSKNSSVSVGFSGAGITSFTPYAGKGKTNSTYESVTGQAGIYAGTDGYDITVKDNTALTGSVIDSKAAPDKNSLTTGSLTMKDIKNKASYEDSYRGIGYTYDRGFNVAEENAKRRGYATAEEKEALDNNYNKVGLVPDLGMSSKESASSVTKSAIAPGKLTVTKEPVNLNTVNRDTKNSLHELGKIFDKKKLEERQELAKLFAKNADEAIHQISESKGWENGSKEKIALHTLVGGITAELGGHAFIDGGLAGGVNEAAVAKLMNAIGKDNPDMVQIASAVLGYATNKLAGKDRQAGAAVAQWGTKWNSEYTMDMIVKDASWNGFLGSFETKVFQSLGEFKEIAGKGAYKFLSQTGAIVWVTTPIEITINHDMYSKSYVYAADGVILLGVLVSAGLTTSYADALGNPATTAAVVSGGSAVLGGYIKARYIPEKTEEERQQENNEYNRWFDNQYKLALEGELPD